MSHPDAACSFSFYLHVGVRSIWAVDSLKWSSWSETRLAAHMTHSANCQTRKSLWVKSCICKRMNEEWNNTKRQRLNQIQTRSNAIKQVRKQLCSDSTVDNKTIWLGDIHSLGQSVGFLTLDSIHWIQTELSQPALIQQARMDTDSQHSHSN